MTIREQAAKTFDHTVVGKLKRCKDVAFDFDGNHYATWLDEAGNEYTVQKDGNKLVCISGDTWVM